MMPLCLNSTPCLMAQYCSEYTCIHLIPTDTYKLPTWNIGERKLVGLDNAVTEQYPLLDVTVVFRIRTEQISSNTIRQRPSPLDFKGIWPILNNWIVHSGHFPCRPVVIYGAKR